MRIDGFGRERQTFESMRLQPATDFLAGVAIP
jgi:hypothetical protein